MLHINSNIIEIGQHLSKLQSYEKGERFLEHGVHHFATTKGRLFIQKHKILKANTVIYVNFRNITDNEVQMNFRSCSMQHTVKLFFCRQKRT